MIEDLIAKQHELMLKVPHAVRDDVPAKMLAGIKIIDTLLRFLNSTGHKPWRPIPLSQQVQDELFDELHVKVGALLILHQSTPSNSQPPTVDVIYTRQLVSALGVIEETVEYINSLSDGSTREHKLEELTDVLFFYMEQMILGEFTWQEVEEAYHRKHAINLKRYEDAKKGDYNWDKRGKENL